MRVEQAPSLRDVYTIVATSPIVVHYSKAQSHTFVADCLSAEDLGSLCLFQGCKKKQVSNNKIIKIFLAHPPSHPPSCPNLAKHASFLWIWLFLNILGQLDHHPHSESDILGVSILRKVNLADNYFNSPEANILFSHHIGTFFCASVSFNA